MSWFCFSHHPLILSVKLSRLIVHFIKSYVHSHCSFWFPMRRHSFFLSFLVYLKNFLFRFLRVKLLTMNDLSFFFQLKNAIMPPSLLTSRCQQCRISSRQLFPFNFWKLLCLFLLASAASGKCLLSFEAMSSQKKCGISSYTALKLQLCL